VSLRVHKNFPVLQGLNIKVALVIRGLGFRGFDYSWVKKWAKTVKQQITTEKNIVIADFGPIFNVFVFED